jgi:hypothetical protein
MSWDRSNDCCLPISYAHLSSSLCTASSVMSHRTPYVGREPIISKPPPANYTRKRKLEAAVKHNPAARLKPKRKRSQQCVGVGCGHGCNEDLEWWDPNDGATHCHTVGVNITDKARCLCARSFVEPHPDLCKHCKLLADVVKRYLAAPTVSR